jgi:hypothetical protein
VATAGTAANDPRHSPHHQEILYQGALLSSEELGREYCPR